MRLPQLLLHPRLRRVLAPCSAQFRWQMPISCRLLTVTGRSYSLHQKIRRLRTHQVLQHAVTAHPEAELEHSIPELPQHAPTHAEGHPSIPETTAKTSTTLRDTRSTEIPLILHTEPPRPAAAASPPPPPPPTSATARSLGYQDLAGAANLEPAGLSVRTPKLSQAFQQPSRPHLLKVVMLGAPNAGKSTLLNKLVGEDISVVSPMAQTTRTRVMASLTRRDRQLIFLDTPGVIIASSKVRSKVNRGLITTPWHALDEADHIVIVVDAYKAVFRRTATEEEIFQRLSQHYFNRTVSPSTTSAPGVATLPPSFKSATLVMNKVDLLSDAVIAQELAQHYQALYPGIVETLHLSGITPDARINTLRQSLLDRALPNTPWLVAPNFRSDLSDMAHVEDIIRAELFTALTGYLPYIVRQENLGWTKLGDDRNTLRIDQILYVDNARQKKIVVGQKGAVIQQVSSNARVKIAQCLKRPVLLVLTVKVSTSLHR
ncbi:hypothetical protein H4R34_002762 [Dimargaris verticillata]|uniref:KH type-2 domain-containing protein n=1 Tax=Dimargaris verticillata TaxID=2761393 RepID=A0A9W8B7G2_9FUNG|nr:hypothetical protein H4R34_002762 [Dimargaris verticillata]